MSTAITPPAWTTEALCAQVDPDLWYPDKGGSSADAKAVCGRCPVREQCLEYGISERHGIFGGLSERERHKVLKARRRGEAVPA